MQRSRVTIIDVAQVAGVSKSTVANVLRAAPGVPIHETTRRRVLDAASQLGYQRNAIAAAFSSGRTNTVGVLLPGHHLRATSRVYRTYGQDVFVAMFEAASRARLRVTSIPDSEESSVAELADRRVDGVILASLRSPDVVRAIYASGIPCVEVGSGFGDRLIHPDNEGGAALAVAHLAELGHRRIVHFRGPLGAYFASERRFEGFLAACRAHALSAEDCPAVSGIEEVAELLRRPASERPTAVFAFNDNQANEVLDLAHGLGLRVPADLSIVGFDNGVVAELTRPRLTTVDNAIDLQADAAIRLLQTLMQRERAGNNSSGEDDAEEPCGPVSVPTRLVIRESTAAAPALSQGD